MRDKKHLILVAGARPNFVKVAPIIKQLEENTYPFSYTLLHTGQHYDYLMSRAIFEDLELPVPDIYLGVGSGTHAQQTARIMLSFEEVLLRDNPELVVVFGDVNSTLACALTAKKLNIPVAHVEAGLRSFDQTMPEEINRRLTDAISELLFTPSEDANENLLREGISEDRIFFVGNIMIDSLLRILNSLKEEEELSLLSKFNVSKRDYILVTLHRPFNVDSMERLSNLIKTLTEVSNDFTVLFPVHPRTEKNMRNLNINLGNYKNFIILPPLRYRDFIILEKNAKLVITDSGGIQEETTFMKIPCITLRPNTERPITLTLGTNRLSTPDELKGHISRIIEASDIKGEIPPLWDGRTSQRILDILLKKL